MIILDRHPFVFKQVKAMVEELCSSSKYDDVVLMLGYNIFPSKIIPEIRNKYPGKRIAIYNLEQMYDGSPWVNENCISWMRNVDEVWDYNLNNMEYLKNNFGIKTLYHPIKWVKALQTIPKVEPEYDVLFYGEETPRRYKYLQNIRRNFPKVRIITASGVTGETLDNLIARSKIILNIHAFDNYTNQEIVRIFYPLINGKCILSEHSRDDSYAGNSIVYCDVEDMGEKIVELLENDKYLEIADRASETYRKHCYRK